MTRPFQFGVRSSARSRRDWLDFARKAEESGFDSLAVIDHFDTPLAPVPALAAAAAVTSRIRLSTVVLANDFRQVAVLAKEAATLDVLSEGRLELGIGSGWLSADYRQAGVSYASPGERVRRLMEAVAVCKLFFAGGTVSYAGEFLHVDGLPATPRAVQRPHPPFLIGGRRRRMVQFAAREADIVSIQPGRERADDPEPTPLSDKVDWVRRAAGPRFDSLVLHCNSNFEVTDDPQTAIERVASRMGVPPAEVRGQPTRLFGDVESIVDQLYRWRAECGISYFTVVADDLDALVPIVGRLAGG